MVLITGAAVLMSRPVYLIGVELGFWQPFSRPQGVSAGARYVPTLKSKTWFECSVDRLKDVDICRAWDGDGQLIAFGRYRLDEEKRSAKARELRPYYVQIYPGHPNLAWITLFDGETLVPVNEEGEPLERFEVHIDGDNH